MKKITIKNIGQFEIVQDFLNGSRDIIIEGRDSMEVIEENVNI